MHDRGSQHQSWEQCGQTHYIPTGSLCKGRTFDVLSTQETKQSEEKRKLLENVSAQSRAIQKRKENNFLEKRFQILQNIQDRMTLDQNMKRAKDFITNHTTCQAPDEAVSKDSNTRDDSGVEDILKFCKQRR